MRKLKSSAAENAGSDVMLCEIVVRHTDGSPETRHYSFSELYARARVKEMLDQDKERDERRIERIDIYRSLYKPACPVHLESYGNTKRR